MMATKISYPHLSSKTVGIISFLHTFKGTPKLNPKFRLCGLAFFVMLLNI